MVLLTWWSPAKSQQSKKMINTILFIYITVQHWQTKFYIIVKHTHCTHATQKNNFGKTFENTLWSITLDHLSSHILHCGAILSNMHTSLCYWKVQHATLIRVTTVHTEKIPHCSLTFPDEIVDNVSNKCTFINTISACYEVSVTFQQLTNNATRWTSEMQKELKYEQSTGKLYDVLSTCPCTSKALWLTSNWSKFVTSILLRCHNQISQTTHIPWPFPNISLICAFSLTSAEFPDISRFPEIPEKW